MLQHARSIRNLPGTLKQASALRALLGRWVTYFTATFGSALIAFSLSRSFWLSLGFMIPVGFSMMASRTASNTLIQIMVPDPLRGRVMSLYSMMAIGMAPFGTLAAGAAAAWVGAPLTLAAGGGVCLLAAIVFRLYLPSLRQEARRMLPPHDITADG
jgi:MFS family permease